MAKTRPTDFTPAAGFGPGDDAPAPGPAADPRDAEIARLRAELAARDGRVAELEAAAGDGFEAGRRYRVALEDGPAAVVECRPGEHPYEAYKRLTGVRGSVHVPEVSPADGEAPGLLKPGR